MLENPFKDFRSDKLKDVGSYNFDEEKRQLLGIVREMSEPIALFLDLDENLTNTVKYWHRIISKLLKRYLRVPNDKLPTYEELCEKGGTDAVYPQFFTELGGREAYLDFLEMLRHFRSTNLRPEAMEEEIQKFVLAAIEKHSRKIGMAGYITARPGTEIVNNATKEQIFQGMGLPDRPILMRPSTFDLSTTSAWKISQLEECSETSPTGEKLMVMIDDSLSLAAALKLKNQERILAGKLPIIQVVYAGPLTRPKVEAGTFQPDHANGIFLMNSWSELDSIFEEIQRQWPAGVLHTDKI